MLISKLANPNTLSSACSWKEMQVRRWDQIGYTAMILQHVETFLAWVLKCYRFTSSISIR